MLHTFIQTLIWISTTTLLYKSMLLFHQVMLYTIAPQTLYGVQGTLFAIIYTGIALTNFGFEETLLPFFSIYSQSKQQFQQILYHFILRLSVIAIFSVAFYQIMIFSKYNIIEKIRIYCDNGTCMIIASIFFVENIKKSISFILQLAFFNKQISIAQLSMLSSYIIMVWGSFWWYKTISIKTIFVPMFIVSAGELMYLTIVLYQYYKHLPTHDKDSNIHIPTDMIIYQRIYNWIHQLSKIIISPNTIKIIFACVFGLHQAAIFNFYITMISFMYACIHKIVGTTTGTIFSAIHSNSQRYIHKIFKTMTQAYIKVITIMSIIMLAALAYGYYINTINYLLALQIMLFFIINCLEQIALIYEQFLISQKHSFLLAMVNIIEICILLPLLYIVPSDTLLYTFMIIKIASFIVMKLYIQQTWNM